MALDSAKNFARGTLTTGYAAGAISIVLQTGHGARFPTVPFNAVWWNVSTYSDPADDPNVEVVRVTNITTDTLTITRAQEGTSATAKNTSGKTYKLIAGQTAKVITDIQTAIDDAGGTSFDQDLNTTDAVQFTNVTALGTVGTLLLVQSTDPNLPTFFQIDANGTVGITPETDISLDAGTGTIDIASDRVLLGNVVDGQTSRVRIDSDLFILHKANTVPPDFELAAGEVAFWFDKTNGAAKLKIKGKQADGTVVTGEVALAP